MIPVRTMESDREGPMEDSSVGCKKMEKEGDVVREENESNFVDLYVKSNLICSICEKTLSSNFYLQHHMLYVHNDKKMFVCEFCMKTFKAPNHLKLHTQRLHNKNKHYFCNQCTANFGLQYDLKVHAKTHVKDNKFICEFCDKILANQRSLEEHRRTHTYERPYPCTSTGCGLRFGQRKTLRVHSRWVK